MYIKIDNEPSATVSPKAILIEFINITNKL